jgi:hypothetical protein
MISSFYLLTLAKEVKETPLTRRKPSTQDLLSSPLSNDVSEMSRRISVWVDLRMPIIEKSLLRVKAAPCRTPEATP